MGMDKDRGRKGSAGRDPMAEMRELAGVNFLDDGVLAEGLDGEGREYLAKKLSAMDERAGAMRADVNDLVREGLALAEDAEKTGAEGDFWREFRQGSAKVMEGFVQLSKALQAARQTVGYETDAEAVTVTEDPAAPKDEDAETSGDDEAEAEGSEEEAEGSEEEAAAPAKKGAKQEGVQYAPADRKKVLMALYKKQKAIGDGKVQGGKHVVYHAPQGKSFTLEDLSDEELRALAIQAGVLKATQEADELFDLPGSVREAQMQRGQDHDPIAELVLGSLTERSAKKPAKDPYEVLKVAKAVMGDKKPREVNHVKLGYADAVNILQAYELLGPEKGKKLLNLPMRDLPSTAQSVVLHKGGGRGRKGLPDGAQIADAQHGYEMEHRRPGRAPTDLDNYLSELEERDTVLDELAQQLATRE